MSHSSIASKHKQNTLTSEKATVHRFCGAADSQYTMTRPKHPQQSNPRLSLDINKHKKRCGLDRVVLVILLLILVPMAAVFNFFFLRVQYQHQHQARPVMRVKSSPSIASLPDLPRMPTPTKGGTAEWHLWAAKPLLGSFRYSNSALLHFPFMDLDPVYQSVQKQGKMESFGDSMSEYPQAVAVKGADIAVPDQHTCFALTRKGYKPDPMGGGTENSVNQDRVAIMTFPNKQDEWWLGLFDGHGDLGHVVSQYASLEFPKRILSLSSKSSSLSQEQTKDQVKQIYQDIDNALPTDVNVGGSTAISIWKTKDLLYISNLGDSQAFVASFDKNGNDVKIIQKTQPHKPDLPEERARIEAAGGRVELPPLPGYSARVIIPINMMDAMGLAMSRSLGDSDGKKLGVSNEPTTEVLDLTSLSKDLNYVVVAATDGIFDQLPIMEVATHVAKSFNTPAPLGLAEAMEQLIMKSSHKWFDESTAGGMFQYRDDISIAVHKLNI
jgi:serine/threonine protein phosphatase PrpC